jgi:hypothetical protein
LEEKQQKKKRRKEERAENPNKLTSDEEIVGTELLK